MKGNRMFKKWFALNAVSILLLILVFYLSAIGGGYIWDDDYYVTNNLTLRSLEGKLAIM